MFPICFQVHKFKMAGLHPVLLFGTKKKDCVSCECLSGLEVVTDTENASMKAVRTLYESLLSVIVKREANTSTPVDPEGPRELAESSLHPEATEEEEEEEEGEEEETFSLLLTPCDLAPTAPATAPSTSHSPPGPSSPSSSPPLSNSKESCPTLYPDPAPTAPATAPFTSWTKFPILISPTLQLQRELSTKISRRKKSQPNKLQVPQLNGKLPTFKNHS
ncbi:proteoglycan 4-like [Hippoglossus hippoglossus]|uniref:proteoglycan 4-like n=1 Tax=Hippoglossus hippoglossus TaxID=8267 RepID=UPI00148D3981|nr:proteoglycan 4-like [Hippoglossus hippoglossus]